MTRTSDSDSVPPKNNNLLTLNDMTLYDDRKTAQNDDIISKSTHVRVGRHVFTLKLF